MRDWDPIGVGEQAPDEYDAYVGTVYVMLMDSGASEQQLFDYLFDIERNHMGLSSNGIAARRAAAVLVQARPEFERTSDEPF